MDIKIIGLTTDKIRIEKPTKKLNPRMKDKLRMAIANLPTGRHGRKIKVVRPHFFIPLKRDLDNPNEPITLTYNILPYSY